MALELALLEENVAGLGEDAVATLVVPVSSLAWAGKVEWIGADGTVRSASRGPPEFVLSLKRNWDAALDWLTR